MLSNKIQHCIETHATAKKVFLQIEGKEYTYQDLLEFFKKPEIKPSGVMTIDAEKCFEMYARVLGGLINETPFCLLDSSWPARRKNKIRRQLEGFNRRGISYVMFTSGSSSHPKGVCVSSDNLLNLWQHLDELPLVPREKISQFYDSSFDPFIADLFFALKWGSCLFPFQKNQSFSLMNFIKDSDLEVVSWVPSLARMNLKDVDFTIDSVGEIIFTGESLNFELASMLRKVFPRAKFFNFYGPTECTVWTHWFELPKSFDRNDGSVPIGKCFSGLKCKLSEDKTLVVRGDQVASGYIENSFEGEFDTGDLAKVEGDLWSVHGRKDQQIKLGGKRVNLRELDLLLQEEFTKYEFLSFYENKLFLACTASQDLKTDIEKVISENLPQYFHPKEIIFLKELPKLSSGKIDKQSLIKEIM